MFVGVWYVCMLKQYACVVWWIDCFEIKEYSSCAAMEEKLDVIVKRVNWTDYSRLDSDDECAKYFTIQCVP